MYVFLIITVYLSFSNETYRVYEDEGLPCVKLTIDKPAVSNITILVNDVSDTATRKFSNYYFIWNMKL